MHRVPAFDILDMEGLTHPEVLPCSSTSDSNSSTEQLQNSQPESENSGNSALNQVKNDLKFKIQKKYIQNGQGPLQISFDPPPTYELTEEEKKKREIRKMRNRKSANISRVKRKIKEDSLQREVDTLENDHKKLKREIQHLKVLKEKMKEGFKNHLLRCQMEGKKLQQQYGSEGLQSLKSNLKFPVNSRPHHNGVHLFAKMCRTASSTQVQTSTDDSQTLSPDSPIEVEMYSRQRSEGFDANTIQQSVSSSV
ncbi:cyclic AMP-responsive element-binding protein 3-like protein 2 isoform X2 [Ostrea edulis]|uniref:cyclic AMP-responsive element-binding protein 3-like protein 2 isoform X2 n=1 Tax=Ostrea edulis TaxID=37623 RepID=UPI002094B723|nr:cyclic AMP-responsive element-binding protein 3-like protein 2 isoform X2 [Ostrea edulis]